MRTRSVVTIALLALLGVLSGHAALSNRADDGAAAHRTRSDAVLAVRGPLSEGAVSATPIPLPSPRNAVPLAVLATSAVALLAALWFLTDTALAVPALALTRSTRRRRAPPLPLI